MPMAIAIQPECYSKVGFCVLVLRGAMRVVKMGHPRPLITGKLFNFSATQNFRGCLPLQPGLIRLVLRSDRLFGRLRLPTGRLY